MRFKHVLFAPNGTPGTGQALQVRAIAAQRQFALEVALVTICRTTSGPLIITQLREIIARLTPASLPSSNAPGGPPFFILSVKAGGTGLTLTAASHVIHFDRWWNPAVENQATDRAYRIGQKRNVLVHKFVTRGTIEERIDAMIESKKATASELLTHDGATETLLTEMSNEALLAFIALDATAALTAQI